MEAWKAALAVGWMIWLICGLPPLGPWIQSWWDSRTPDYVPEEWVEEWRQE